MDLSLLYIIPLLSIYFSFQSCLEFTVLSFVKYEIYRNNEEVLTLQSGSIPAASTKPAAWSFQKPLTPCFGGIKTHKCATFICLTSLREDI
jgi:hypothetical protein